MSKLGRMTSAPFGSRAWRIPSPRMPGAASGVDSDGTIQPALAREAPRPNSLPSQDLDLCALVMQVPGTAEPDDATADDDYLHVRTRFPRRSGIARPSVASITCRIMSPFPRRSYT